MFYNLFFGNIVHSYIPVGGYCNHRKLPTCKISEHSLPALFALLTLLTAELLIS